MVYKSQFIIATKLPIDHLWTILSDTSRMNKAMGLPAWDEAELNGSRIVRTKVFGQQQEWVESPWTWIVNQEIRQERIYKTGLMQKQTGVFKILKEKTPEGLIQTEISFTWTGNILLRYIIGPLSERFLKDKMTWYIREQERIYFAYAKEKTTALTTLRPLNESDHRLITTIMNECNSADGIIFKNLLQYLLASDSLDIYKINPKKIAQEIDLPLAIIVEQLTLLTKFGYMVLTWDVVCPHCRGPQLEVSKLRLVSEASTCATCDLRFSVQSEQAIEVTFKPQPKFREIKSIVYCAAEPAKKAHILIHWPVEISQNFIINLKILPGQYRVRTVRGKKDCQLVIYPSNVVGQKVTIDFSKSVVECNSGDIEFSFVSLENDYLVLESLAWTEEKFLAGEALSNTHIRTLVNDDLLKSGVKLDIGEQIILFTDIVGSTPMYKKLGDNQAFLAVQDHYAEVEKLIQSNNGVVVKFIGDAVMAAFTNANLAFKANQEIHSAFKNNKNGLVLRTSFHIGKVLCVNMNVGLDYFGQTVNTAAKLQGWANGYETAVSAQTLERVLESERSQLTIKKSGFDDKLQEQVIVF